MTMTKIEAPREDLIRMSTTLRQDEGGNLLVGYASVFNEPTEIDSWEGRFIERIAPGAFRKTLRERGDHVKVLFNHGLDPSIGDKPLGKPRVIKEDDRGLYVEVPLDDTSYNADIKALLRSGALDGMSFRMTVVDDKWTYPDDDGLPERTIKEIRLYEFGPVTFPAYAATQAGVRAHAPSAFEAWRSAAGIPKVSVPEQGREAAKPADKPVTGDENGPASDATRDESPSSEYRPAQPVPVSFECRKAQRDEVRRMLAHLERKVF